MKKGTGYYMEENKKEELDGNTFTETQDLDKPEKPEEPQRVDAGENREAPLEENTGEQGMPTRSFVLMLLAGVYLLYTGYKLCESVLTGADGASWGFFAAGIAFLVIGAVMLFVGGKNAMRKSRERKAEEEREREQNPEPEAPRRMTIAERARLAGDVAEKEAREAEGSDQVEVMEAAGEEKNSEKEE